MRMTFNNFFQVELRHADSYSWTDPDQYLTTQVWPNCASQSNIHLSYCVT